MRSNPKSIYFLTEHPEITPWRTWSMKTVKSLSNMLQSHFTVGNLLRCSKLLNEEDPLVMMQTACESISVPVWDDIYRSIIIMSSPIFDIIQTN